MRFYILEMSNDASFFFVNRVVSLWGVLPIKEKNEVKRIIFDKEHNKTSKNKIVQLQCANI